MIVTKKNGGGGGTQAFGLTPVEKLSDSSVGL